MTNMRNITVALIVYLLVTKGSHANSDDDSDSLLDTLRILISEQIGKPLQETRADSTLHHAEELNTGLKDERSGPPKATLSDSDTSPIALYLIKRLMAGPPKSEMPPKRSRDLREDHVITVHSRDGKFPWDEECSRGYTHCGGYFPSCCKGFVCLKPLTDWDRRNKFIRCWPDYFQVDEADLESTNE